MVRRKIHANELQAKLNYYREDSMFVTANHLHYSIKGVIEECEDCATDKIRHKLLRKVGEEHNLNQGKMIYIDIISQKKASYGGSNNCIIIQESDTNQFFLNSKNQKNIWLKNHPFLK